MVNVLILGMDSDSGQAIAAAADRRIGVNGLRFTNRPDSSRAACPSVTSERLIESASQADVLVFCGGAARSSWDESFGSFDEETQWLSECLAVCRKSNCRMVYISSDAVFSGPQVFHDDDSSSIPLNRIPADLLKWELAVSRVPGSLIVRTNVINQSPNGFLSSVIGSLENGRTCTVPSSDFATPIAAETFADLLLKCVAAELSGVVNIGGSERTTAFHLAAQVARGLNLPVELLVPEPRSKCTERSLRCDRLRRELNIFAPDLKQTVECLLTSDLRPIELSAA
ncbi:MAG: sugar nucleotide-binding protein [Planctomycetaceae bacterium]